MSASRTIRFTVALPSGKQQELQLPEATTVGELRWKAQKAFGHGFLNLYAANKLKLHEPEKTLHAAGVQIGDHITAVALPVSIATNGLAFALTSPASSIIVAWGALRFGANAPIGTKNVSKVCYSS